MKQIIRGIFLILISPMAAFAQSSLGPAVAVLHEVPISMRDCEKSWRVESRIQASCKVSLFKAKSAYVIYPDIAIADWTYNSEKGWKLKVTAEAMGHGYELRIKADGPVPREHLDFKIAQKYILTALDGVDFDEAHLPEVEKNRSYRTIIMQPSTEPMDQGTSLGRMQQVTRVLNLDNPKLIQQCAQDIANLESGGVCYFSMQNSLSGDLILTDFIRKTEVKATVQAQEVILNMELNALPAWRFQSPFSLAIVKISFKGAFNTTLFQRMYFQALQNMNIKKFSIHALRPEFAEPPVERFYSEAVIGTAEFYRHPINLDIPYCSRVWTQPSKSVGECSWAYPNNFYRIATEWRIASGRAAIGNRSLFGVLVGENHLYTFKAFGSNETVGRFDQAKDLIQKWKDSIAPEIFYDVVLRLPKAITSTSYRL